jgi:hypothetical protein
VIANANDFATALLSELCKYEEAVKTISSLYFYAESRYASQAGVENIHTLSIRAFGESIFESEVIKKRINVGYIAN